MTLTEEKMSIMMDNMMTRIQSMLDSKIDTIKMDVRDLKEDLNKKHDLLHARTEQLQGNNFAITERQHPLEGDLRQLKQAYASIKKELMDSYELRLEELKKEFRKGNTFGRNHILWFRGMRMDSRGRPLDLGTILGNDIPRMFFTMCSGVTKRGRMDFTFNVKKGYT